MKLSIPYNYDLNLVYEIAKRRPKNIDELYLPADQSVVGSGRPHKQPNDYDKQVPVIIDLMHKHGIKVNMLINGQCEGLAFYEERNLKRLLEYIRFFRNEFGLDSITVIDAIHLEDIKNYIPDIELHSAVNLMVNTVQKARYLKALGADVITIDKDINKDIGMIKKIKEATGLSLKMLVNDSCLPDCVYRIQHANAVGHVGCLNYEEYEEFGKDINLVFIRQCGKLYKESPWLFFKSSFIRPDDIKYYEGIVDSIKIVDRMGSTGEILNIIDAYSKDTYSGDLLDLVFVGKAALRKKGITILNGMMPEDFFAKITSCSKDCMECNYCRNILGIMAPKTG